jgi:CRP-like cAMP-binding protein
MADGRQALLWIRVSGDLIGEISALNGTPRSASATATDIAGLCGSAGVSLQRAMRELRQSGVVDTRYRSVVVTDLAALRALAELDGHDQF